VEYFFAGYVVLAMFIAAGNPKALGVCICFCLGLLLVHPDVGQGGLLTVFLVPAAVYATFRD
jgi:hypothetical protein